MLRPGTLDDCSALRALAAETEMFMDPELDGFMAEVEVVLTTGATPEGAARSLIVADAAQGALAGAAYFGPEAMADRVANLVFIAVAAASRRKGVASALIAAFEADADARGARLGVIETAGDRAFAPAWALYERHGYREEARIRDFFADGFDKLIFTKRF